MKKIISLFLIVTALVLTLSACGGEKTNIESYTWTLRYAMHGEGEQLAVDAVDKADPAHPDAKIVSVTLTASNGKITVTDETNQKVYLGSYTVEGKSPKSTDYLVTLDGKSGYATVAMTTYADGTKEPTLPINLDGYALYFYAREDSKQ